MKTIQAQSSTRLLSLALGLAFFHASAATAETTPPVGKMQKNPTHASASNDGLANWKRIAQSKDTKYYSDVASIRREGPTVVVRQMIDYREGFTSDFRSTIDLHTYNCNRRTMKLTSRKYYKSNMGEGALFKESTESVDLGSPTAGSVDEINFNFACNANPVNP